jgi:hypothetical protein
MHTREARKRLPSNLDILQPTDIVGNGVKGRKVRQRLQLDGPLVAGAGPGDQVAQVYIEDRSVSISLDMFTTQ